MLIIGITGTLGAGKGTLVEYLLREKGFAHYSVRAFITQEIIQRNMPVNRDSMVLVANDLRQKNGPSYIVDCLYEQAFASGQNCVIESIRTPGEIDSLKRKGRFYLFAVDAAPQIRYRRISSRGSETDSVSFDTFLANEEREMQSHDPNHQNLRECIRRADFVLNNDGNIEELYARLVAILQTFED
jgi:dephospho-CoA kinase